MWGASRTTRSTPSNSAVLVYRRATQLGWQAELQRWAATQLSAAHPNHEHIALLWNVQSQRCASLADAFIAAGELVKLPLEAVRARAL